MALANGRPRLVFGTMGGEAQVQIHLQLLARMLVARESPDDALADKRVDELSLRFRNSAIAFILVHELGHLLFGLI